MYDNEQVLHQGTVRFAEVKFYFRATIAGVQESLALGSMYSPADDSIEEFSHGALNVFKYEGEDSLVIIKATSILSVVAMVPFRHEDGGNRFSLTDHPAIGMVTPDDTLDLE